MNWRKSLTLLAVLVVVGGRQARADGPTCPASAQVDGDAVVADRVRTLLSERGLAAPAEGCQGVVAHVTAGPGGVTVQVTDPSGRESQRVIDTPEHTATFVESWARSDLSAPLLVPLAPLSFPAPASPPESLDTGTVFFEVDRPIHTLGLALGPSFAYSSDGGVWAGAELSGCVRVGRVCVGADAHVLRDTGLGQRHEIRAHRLAADLTLDVDLSYRVGRASVTPGLGVGVGWLHNDVGRFHGEHIDADKGGLRTSGHVIVSIPISRRFAIDVGLALDVAPMAMTQPWESGGAMVPGEPRGYLRGMAGLRYGEP